MRFNRLDFVFNPNDFRDATFIEEKPLDSSLLQKGEVIIAVDRLALTANTYPMVWLENPDLFAI